MSLIPKSNQALNSQEKGWQTIPQPDDYIANINTRDLNDDIKRAEMFSYLNAIPNPFARLNLFKSVLNQSNLENELLKRIKSDFNDELRGLLIAIAQDDSMFRTESILLDKDNMDKIDNFFDLKSVLPFFISTGDWEIWTRFSNESYEDANSSLNIDLLYYNNQLVAYFNPFTLFSTTEDYKLETNKAYINKEGKFSCTDQIELNTAESAYVNMIINGLKPEKGLHNLVNCLDKIQRNQTAIISNDINLLTERKSKIAQLFNSEKLFSFDEDRGVFSRVSENDKNGFYLSDLFLNVEETAIYELKNNNNCLKENDFASYLEVEVEGEENSRYFTWPFSRLGLKYLSDRILGTNETITLNNVKIENGSIEIDLSINVGGPSLYPKKIRYDIYNSDDQINSERIIIWPDFISDAWEDNYYVYNELSKDSLKALNTRFLVLNENNNYFELENTNNKLTSSGNDRRENYEILISEKPIMAVEFYNANNGKKGGVIFRKDKAELAMPNDKYDIGFDFGSNNSCIAIQNCNSNSAELFNFENRRKFFIGAEVLDNVDQQALQHEMLFFTNETFSSNKIKSLVLLSKENIQESENLPLLYAKPVFEDNINIISTNFVSKKIKVKLSDEEEAIRYDLKWLQAAEDKKLLRSFLSTLLIMTKAELLASKSASINKLAWAFPGVDENLQTTYNEDIWTKVLNPLTINNAIGDFKDNITESEAIFWYMESDKGNVLASDNVIGVGVDVGGSTTDVVYKSKKGINEVYVQSLYIAAGSLAKRTNSEENFYNYSKDFLRTHNNPKAKLINTPEGSNSFLFNQIIDFLPINEIGDYYQNIRVSSPNLYVVNAYLTGFLLYQIGVQIGEMMRADTDKNVVDLQIYGKGGQIFDWIYSQFRDQGFFEDCLINGIAISLNDDDRVNELECSIQIPMKRNSPDALKTEVAFGLCKYIKDGQVDSVKTEVKSKIRSRSTNSENSKTEKLTNGNNLILEKLVPLREDDETLNFNEVITTSVLEKIGSYNIKQEPEFFNFYLGIFEDFLNASKLKHDDTIFNDYIKKWNFANFIGNHEICSRAIKNKNVEPTISILALEAECFLERILLPSLK